MTELVAGQSGTPPKTIPITVTPAGLLMMSSGAENPTSTLTRPSDTTAYTAGDLVASNTTAGSVVVPSVSVARVAAGGLVLAGAILRSNHTTGLSGTQVQVRLWKAAPTYTNGDNGAYAVATGAASLMCVLSGTFEQHADGAFCELTLANYPLPIKLASGQVLYWDIKLVTGFTPQSGKTFTFEPLVLQD